MENEHEMLGGDDVDAALIPSKQEERDILDDSEVNGGGVEGEHGDDDLLGVEPGGDEGGDAHGGDEPPGTGANKLDNDLFDAVLTERSNAKQTSSTTSASPSPSLGSQSHKDSHNASSAASVSFGAASVAGRKYCVYAGNMTWWTTDMELASEVRDVGVDDVIDIKFYYNHSNGQSKGFALVVMGSERSQRLCLDKLQGRHVHGQSIAVLPYSKNSLAQFEAATVSSRPTDRRLTDQPSGASPAASTVTAPPAAAPARSTPGQPVSAKTIAASQAAAAAMSAAGTPLHIGTVRIGAGPPSAPPSCPPQQGPPMIRAPMGMVPPRGPPGVIVGGHGQPFVLNMPMSGPIRMGGPPPGVMTQGMRPLGPPPPGAGLPPPMRLGPPGAPPPTTTQAPPGLRMPPPGAHVNPNVYPNVAAVAAHQMPPYSQAPPMMPPPQGIPMSQPPQQQQQQQQPYGQPAGGYGQHQQPQQQNYGRPTYGRPAEHPLTEAEFEEVMNRNRTVSSSAISRAVSDAAARDYSSAVETLVTAISLIRQSRVAHDDRCKVLISSLEDTLSGIEAKANYRTGGGSKSSRSHGREHSRSPESRSSRKRHRRASRSRSRSPHRDRTSGDYSDRRRY